MEQLMCLGIHTDMFPKQNMNADKSNGPFHLSLVLLDTEIIEFDEGTTSLVRRLWT